MKRKSNNILGVCNGGRVRKLLTRYVLADTLLKRSIKRQVYVGNNSMPKMFRLLTTVTMLLVSGIWQLSYAQSVSCPTIWTEISRTSTELTCTTKSAGTGVIGDCSAAGGTYAKLADQTCTIPLSSVPTLSSEPASLELITSNPMIKPFPDSYLFSTGLAVDNLVPQLENKPALTSAQQDLLARLTDLIIESDDCRQVIGVQNISPEELTSQAVSLRRLNQTLLGNITARLAALRPAISEAVQDLAYHGLPSHPLPGFAGRTTLKARGGAAGDEDNPENSSRLGVFIGGILGDGEKDETLLSSGFDYSSAAYTIGFDYLFSPTVIAGIALGYGSTDTEFSNNGGDMETDTRNVSVYGTKIINDSVSLDAVVGYGNSDYVNRRKFSYTANGVAVNQTAIGRPSSDQLLLSLGVGKLINKAVDIDFGARVNYLDADIDRFTEIIEGGNSQPGSGLALEIDQQEIKSITSDLNVKITKAISTNFGVVLPHASLSWLHEFDDGEDNLRARFLHDPFSIDFTQSGLDVSDGAVPTIFKVPLDDNDHDYGRLGLGLSVLFPRGLTFYFIVNKLLGLDDIDHEHYSLGLRKDF